MEQPQGFLAILQAGSWIAQTGLFLFAVIAVLVGKEQIKTAIIHNRASVVLELDNRWESDAMIESRTLLTDLYATVRTAHAPEAWTMTYNKHLADLRSKDPTKYRTMMRLSGYFETAGWVIGEQRNPDSPPLLIRRHMVLACPHDKQACLPLNDSKLGHYLDARPMALGASTC